MRFVLAILVALFAPAIAQAQIGPAPGGGGSGITALTGDVTASGTGSVAATVAAIAGVAVGTPTGTTNVVFSNSPTLVSPTLGNAIATSFGLSGNISAAAWTTSGIRYKNAAATLTDTSTSVSGTVATTYNDVWGGNTNAAMNASIVYTNVFGSYFKAPIAGTNITITNKYALGADSLFSAGPVTDLQSIGATSTDGYVLTNTTAAATGAQQWSPRLHWTGQGWKTTATAGSETVDWIAEVQPIQGTTTPNSGLVFSSQNNALGYNVGIGFYNTSPIGATSTIAFNGPPGSNPYLTESGGFLYLAYSNGINITAGNGTTNPVTILTSGINLANNGAYCITNNASAINGTCDTFLTRPVAATWQLGAANAASPVNQTLQAQGVIVGTTSNGTGGNLLIQPGVSTGNATTSQLNFDTWVPVGSGTATQIQTLTLQLAGGAVSMPSLAASSAATTGTVCWTTGGNLTVDTTLACLASLEELKDIHGPIENAVDEVLSLEPFSFAWKEGTNQRAGDTQEQLGLGAHQVAAIDKRLVSYSDDGKLLGVRYQEMTALLVQAIKEQQAEIEELKRAR